MIDSGEVDLSVVVVNYNTRHLLEEMMSALEDASADLSCQVILIDNASRDGSVEFIRARWPDMTVIANTTNVGFGRANNQALPLLRGRNVLLLNTDAFVRADSIRVALSQLELHADCGIVGVRLIGRDGTVQHSCRFFPTPWNIFLNRTGLSRIFTGTQLVDDPEWDDRKAAECDWVCGAFLVIRSSVISKIGLFDPRYFLYSEEVDLCRAVKAAGWKVRYCPDTDVIHIGGESAKSDGSLTSSGRQLSVLQVESELLYFRKHYGLAGVMASLMLNAVGDAILAGKRLFGRGRGTGTPFSTTLLSLQICRRTGFATRPTR
jgi:GT2 family glycosyltransferase